MYRTSRRRGVQGQFFPSRNCGTCPAVRLEDEMTSASKMFHPHHNNQCWYPVGIAGVIVTMTPNGFCFRWADGAGGTQAKISTKIHRGEKERWRGESVPFLNWSQFQTSCSSSIFLPSRPVPTVQSPCKPFWLVHVRLVRF